MFGGKRNEVETPISNRWLHPKGISVRACLFFRTPWSWTGKRACETPKRPVSGQILTRLRVWPCPARRCVHCGMNTPLRPS